MAQTQRKKKPISIDEAADGSRQVVLHPENDDVFVRTGKQVIAGCSLGISLGLWLDELSSLIDYLVKWIEDHSAKIESCFVEPRPRCIMIFIVPKSAHFDFDLADELAQLNMRVMKDFNVGMVETHQIPNSGLENFLNPPMAKQIYGEPRKSHPSVEA